MIKKKIDIKNIFKNIKIDYKHFRFLNRILLYKT